MYVAGLRFNGYDLTSGPLRSQSMGALFNRPLYTAKRDILSEEHPTHLKMTSSVCNPLPWLKYMNQLSL